MARCPFCSTENEDAGIACQACGRLLPFREYRTPPWQRTLGWILVWASFATAVVDTELIGFAFLTNAAGWVLFLEDDWILRLALGAVIAVVMCQLAFAIGERFSPLAGVR